MEVPMAEPQKAPMLSVEDQALIALKTKVNTKNYSAVQLVRDINAYLTQFPQDYEVLAPKIGKSPNWVYQMIGFSGLPKEVLDKAKKDGAGFKDLQALKSASRSAKNENIEDKNSAKSAKSAKNETKEEFQVKPAPNQVNQPLATPTRKSGLLSEAAAALAILGAWHLEYAIKVGRWNFWPQLRLGPAVSGPLANGGAQAGVPVVSMLGYDPDHRAILKWDSLGPGFTYHVVYSKSRSIKGVAPQKSFLPSCLTGSSTTLSPRERGG